MTGMTLPLCWVFISHWPGLVANGETSAAPAGRAMKPVKTSKHKGRMAQHSGWIKGFENAGIMAQQAENDSGNSAGGD